MKPFFSLQCSLEWSPSDYYSAANCGGKKKKLQREENKPLIINIRGENSVRKCMKDKNILVTYIA